MFDAQWELDITKQIDDWLTDNEVAPKPIGELVRQPGAYAKQVILNAPFWKAEQRLTVASILIGQPLIAQGADDAAFYLPSDLDIGAQWVTELVVIKIRGLTIADTNRPATEAWARFINKMDEEGIQIASGKWLMEVKASWAEMYMCLHSLARNGVFTDLNRFAVNSRVSREVFTELKLVDERIRTNARAEMEKAERK